MLPTVALCLLGHIDPTHFAGALSEEGALSTRPVEQMTRDELQAELTLLNPHRTSFVGPVVMAGVGAVVIIVGAVLFFAGVGVTAFVSASAMSSMLMGLAFASYILMGLGGIAFIAGGVLLAIGLSRLFPTLARRREAMERRDNVLRQLEAMDPKSGQPPAQPMRPGDVWFSGPRPSLVLVEF